MKKVKTMSFVEFRQNLSECVNLAKYKGERFLITRNGKTVGAFIPVEDLDKIQLMDNEPVKISTKDDLG
ncbi:type II toxin-antitoxin system Phd/YefM family antitoxin [Candidatus Protochlamydia phocaeensis]|uniref:type II toxin-antitoxin system Phd/YefM family antitoxin n=1 Tax=Candidatus Protochlamydia phocaeensis TaxID=1414722 RepID=UPI000838BF06|nr:type II toxin-antitoxin system Phd/YefM family antitoxin [Candidatus Protochlamydia phocaeensis]